MFGLQQVPTCFATEEDWELGKGSTIDHILVNPAAIPMVKEVTIEDRRRKGGHREIRAFRRLSSTIAVPRLKPLDARGWRRSMSSRRKRG
jgi:hypothetical protein